MAAFFSSIIASENAHSSVRDKVLMTSARTITVLSRFCFLLQGQFTQSWDICSTDTILPRRWLWSLSLPRGIARPTALRRKKKNYHLRHNSCDINGISIAISLTDCVYVCTGYFISSFQITHTHIKIQIDKKVINLLRKYYLKTFSQFFVSAVIK